MTIFLAFITLLLSCIPFRGLQADDAKENQGYDENSYYEYDWPGRKKQRIQVGQRPLRLVAGMERGRLKRKLEQCSKGPFHRTDFSIGHRGAPLQFPEHTKESYEAAAQQGAGILECDVTFTNDGHLVCRHAECDLHTTTNILVTDLADHCSVPFTPSDGASPASAQCCTSDISLDQFKSLRGKMDAADRNATTPEEFLGGTAPWRTDLYISRGTLLSHKESIALFHKLGTKFTPELKSGNPERLMEVFGGSNADEAQALYAQAMIDDYKEAGVPPRDVWAQSFNPADVKYWIENEPGFGQQAVYLDNRYDGQIDPVNGDPATFVPTMEEIAADGVRIIAPPMYFLLRVTDGGEIVPSPYARAALDAGLDIIAWTFERSDLRNGSRTGGDGADGLPNATFYYQFDRNPVAQAINTDGDMYKALHVLAQDVGILGIFSDWPATVTYYANCFGLR